MVYISNIILKKLIKDLFNVIKLYELKSLSKEELKDVVFIPAEKENIEFSQEIINLTYELSVGLPYYMHVIAYNRLPVLLMVKLELRN